jgi:hypothetical protein
MSNSQEFKLNEKYTKLSQESAKNNNDDDPFAFGGYVPSAIGQTPRTNSNNNAANNQKRNVSFNDELFNADIFSTPRPKTSPNQGTGAANNNSNQNLMKTMPTSGKSTDDWLGLSGNGKKDNVFDDLLKPRPQTAQPQKQGTNSLSNSNDWGAVKDLASANTNRDRDMGSEIMGSEHSAGNRPRQSLFSQTMPANFSEKPPVMRQTDPLKLTSTKDSMNSSFADSFDVVEAKTPHYQQPPHGAPIAVSTPATGQANRGGGIAALFDTQPQHKQPEHGSMAPSEAEDGWLNNLMNNANKKAQTANVNAVSKKNTMVINFHLFFLYN